MKHFARWTVAALIALAPAAPAHAAYYFDTGTPTGSQSYTLYNDGTAFQRLGTKVEVGSDYLFVDEIEAYFVATEATTVTLTVAAWGLDSMLIKHNATYAVAAGAGWTSFTGLGIDMFADTNYYIQFRSNAAQGVLGMRHTVPTPLPGNYYNNHNSAGWRDLPLGIGIRIGDGLNAVAVPEPASWAMMIGGFGLAGAAMRRRRSPARATA